MKKKIFVSGWKLPCVAVVGLVFAFVCIFSRSVPLAKKPVITPPTSDYVRSVGGIGIVEPKSELINVGVELPGIVSNVAVKVGDVVKKGELLFALDQRDIDAKITILEKKLAVSKIQEEDAAKQFSIVNNIKNPDAVSQDELNRRQYAHKIAVLRVEEIKAQLQQALITKERLNIISPIDAKILEIGIRIGEFANPAALQPLVRIGDTSQMYIRVEIDEQNASSISEHSVAQGLLRGNTEQRIPLSFVRFEPYVKPKQNLAVAGQRVDTRVLQVIYSLPKNISCIYVGQQMDVFVDALHKGEK